MEAEDTRPERDPSPPAPVAPAPDLRSLIEISIRLGALFALVAASLWILAPFVSILLWATIIVVACQDLSDRLTRMLGGRRGLAATLFVVGMLALLVVPAVLLSETLITGAQHFARDVADGTLTVPPPPEKVADVPVVGEQVHALWLLASENLADALARLGPQLQAISRWLLQAAGSTGIQLLQLAASIFVAGFMLARSEGRRATIRRFATRLAGPRGPEFADLAALTIRSVVQGILGVAVVQTILAGIGFAAADVPFPGLWALLVLIAAIVQLPVLVVMVPPILIVFSNANTTVAVVFTVWCVAVALVDNVLKPMLFGRGMQVPTLVIFLGAIGGMVATGIVGLFLGAVILAIAYELFVAWLADGERGPTGTAAL